MLTVLLFNFCNKFCNIAGYQKKKNTFCFLTCRYYLPIFVPLRRSVRWSHITKVIEQNQKASELASFLKIDLLFFVLVSLPIIQFPMILLLVNTSWIINCALFNTITIDTIQYYSVVALFLSLRLGK